MASDTIITTDRLVYVGKISEAVFLYNRDDSTALAIPMNDVTSMTLKNHIKPKK